MPRWQPFEWIVALRFLREGRTQTVFIIVGVAIGVAVIVFMSSLMAGLETNLMRQALATQSHIQLLAPKEVARQLRQTSSVTEGAVLQVPLQRLRGIDQWQALASQMRSIPEVRIVSPGATGSALVVRGDASRAISVIGIDPALYFRIVLIGDMLVAGSTRMSGTDILIGSELASDLGVSVGDKLRVTAASGANLTLSITGIFDLGNKAANARITYMALRTAQSLLALPGGVTVLDLMLTDPYAAETVAQRISVANGVQADSWIKTNAQFFAAVAAQKSSNALIRSFVALSVAMGIASVLVVSVVQRGSEIGILRAMGVTRGQVLRVFLLQGGLLALAGAILGSVIGAGALMLWQSLVRNADGTPLFPVTLPPSLFITALGLATLTGLLAAFAP
ncbi:MAG: ABC transporter permease, partial [Rhodoferax sp.]|nr:ABC transporter permease [Rhodoferax sp.]